MAPNDSTNSMHGKFITFEGTEGAGKSTLVGIIEEHLLRMGIQVIKTREPGGTILAERVREWVIHESMHPRTETLLYLAARSEHVIKLIQPNLQKGTWVLCDRYGDSTLAYQGAGRGLDWEEIKRMHAFATHGLAPDITFLLDLPVTIGLQRASDPNKFEAESIAFHESVRNGFHKALSESPTRWHLLDATQGPEQLASQAIQVIQKRCQLQEK